jgi:hypothetical protein
LARRQGAKFFSNLILILQAFRMLICSITKWALPPHRHHKVNESSMRYIVERKSQFHFQSIFPPVSSNHNSHRKNCLKNGGFPEGIAK